MTPSVIDWSLDARWYMTSYRSLARETNASTEEVMKSLVAVFSMILCVAPVFAQQPDPVAVVAHVLELSPDQITAWSEILHARQAAIEPLGQQAQAREQAIGQALAGANPDPLVIGRAIIELRGLQTQIATVNAQSAMQFEQLLMPDQAQRLNDIRGAAQACYIVPAFEVTGLLGN